MVRIRFILFFYLFTALQVSAQDTPFTLKLEGNTSEGRTLFIAIYDKSARNWLAAPTKRIRLTLPAEQSLTIPLTLTAGAYAIRAFVDLNHNGKLDTSAKGRPLEPFGSSIGHGRNRASLQFKRSILKLHPKTPQARVLLRYPKATLAETSPLTL